MPGARTHDMITVVTASAADVAYLTKAPHPNTTLAVLFTVAYLFAGFACAGDLDLDSREYRRWGPLRFLWWPYRLLVPHRSWISHGMILGGVIRVCYLAFTCTLLVWGALWLGSYFGTHVDANGLTRAGWNTLYLTARAYPQQTFAFLIGFILAGTAHSLADIISTGIKRRF